MSRQEILVPSGGGYPAKFRTDSRTCSAIMRDPRLFDAITKIEEAVGSSGSLGIKIDTHRGKLKQVIVTVFFQFRADGERD